MLPCFMTKTVTISDNFHLFECTGACGSSRRVCRVESLNVSAEWRMCALNFHAHFCQNLKTSQEEQERRVGPCARCLFINNHFFISLITFQLPKMIYTSAVSVLLKTFVEYECEARWWVCRKKIYENYLRSKLATLLCVNTNSRRHCTRWWKCFQRNFVLSSLLALE